VTIAIVAVLVSAALAVFGADRKQRLLLVVFKPLTTLLLFAVVGWPGTTFARWVSLGIGLSVVGDVALLWPGNRAFIAGLAAFLLAHVSYVVAFVGAAVWSPHVAAVAVVVAVATALLLRAIWAGSAGMHLPVVVYGVAITAMVVSASATLGGPLGRAAAAAALGAPLFYVSDSSLALDRFRRPIPHAALLTLGVYWLGQLGIAIAARG
jgi:alkenylglycerophosphocholine/alkenylglycerophosphoethanolamine hydrolase